jgi:hypothetical protein
MAAVTALGSHTPERSRAAAADFSPATCFGGGRAQQNGRLVVVGRPPVGNEARWRAPISLAAPDGSHRRLVATAKHADVLHVVALNSASFAFDSIVRITSFRSHYRLDRVDVRTRRVRPVIRPLPEHLALTALTASPDGSLIELFRGGRGQTSQQLTAFVHANGSSAQDPTGGAIAGPEIDKFTRDRGGISPIWRWSPNGRCLVTIVQSSDTEGVLWYAPVGGGEPVKVPLPASVFSGPGAVFGWTADAERLVVGIVPAQPGHATRRLLYTIGPDASSPKVVMRLNYDDFGERGEDRLSPDRRWFLHHGSSGWWRERLDGSARERVHLPSDQFPAAWLPR